MLQLFVGCSVLSKISVFVHHLAPNETCGCVWSMWGYGETAPRNLREPNVPVLPMYSCSLSIIIYIYIVICSKQCIYIYRSTYRTPSFSHSNSIYTLYHFMIFLWCLVSKPQNATERQVMKRSQLIKLRPELSIGSWDASEVEMLDDVTLWLWLT